MGRVKLLVAPPVSFSAILFIGAQVSGCSFRHAVTFIPPVKRAGKISKQNVPSLHFCWEPWWSKSDEFDNMNHTKHNQNNNNETKKNTSIFKTFPKGSLKERIPYHHGAIHGNLLFGESESPSLRACCWIRFITLGPARPKHTSRDWKTSPHYLTVKKKWDYMLVTVTYIYSIYTLYIYIYYDISWYIV